MRKNYVQPLTVKWVTFNSAIDSNVSANVNFNVSLHPAAPPVYFSLSISSPTDVGGTLQIELKLEKVGLLLKNGFFSDRKITLFFFQDQNQSTIFGCIMHNTLDCEKGSQFSTNSSLVDRKTKVMVPYPKEGFWFLSLYGNCSEYENVFIIIEQNLIICIYFICYTRTFNDTNCDRNITASVQISLSPCQEGACGPHGRCVQYFSAGLIYSTCVCSSGNYRNHASTISYI